MKLHSLFATIVLASALLLTACGSEPATPGAEITTAAFGAPLINEVLGNTDGTDVEYVEIVAAEGASLAGLSIIVVEFDEVSSNGTIDFRVDLGADAFVCENGFFLIGNGLVSSAYGVVPDVQIATNAIENSSYTIALVETSSISGASVTGSEVVLDAVALTDGGAADSFFFDAPVVGPDGTFLPAGVRRVADGVDTDTADDWVIGDFNIGPANTPTANSCERSGGSELFFIHEVQGSGAASPFAGRVVQVEALVVGDFQNNDESDHGDLRGFYLQEEDGDADADPATSEGIFVFDGSGSVDVQAGDLVLVSGEVDEYFGETQISATGVTVLSSGNPLPTAANVTLPLGSIDELEAAEGMSVLLPQALVISEFYNYDRFGEMVLALPFDGLARLYQPTSYDTLEFNGLTPEQTQEAIAVRRVFLDDGRTDQNPVLLRHPNGDAFSLDNRFRGGDTVANVAGVVRYSRGSGGSGTETYRIQPTSPADYTPLNPRTDAPDAVGGELKVAAFNVLNYFTTIDRGPDICGPNLDQDCRGADSEQEFERQQAKIVAALAAIDADVFGVIEIQNNEGVVAELAEALNSEVGPGTYAAVVTGTDGSDAIKVGLIYKPARVVTVGAPAVLDDASFTDPTGLGEQKSRPALAQSFAALDGGGVVTVVVNHLKSKGSSCGPGDDDPLAGSCDLTRTLAAEALADWIAADPTGVGESDALIIGDLNSYDEESPIAVLAHEGYSDLLEEYEGEFAYTYLFDGQFGHLDYALANETLTPQVTGATAWHINADEPDILDYDTSFKPPAQQALYAPNAYRSSDHDPVLVGLELEADPEVLFAALRAEVAALKTEGTLNRGQARSLEAKLDAAQRSFARGRSAVAVNQVGAFMNQARDLADDGVLSTAQADVLLRLAAALVSALG